MEMCEKKNDKKHKNIDDTLEKLEREFSKNLNLTASHVHGKNILAKLKRRESLSEEQKKWLVCIAENYIEWKKENEELKEYDDDTITKRVEYLNEYKKIIKNAPFSAQSKFQSTVLEEFMYYLFRDYVEEKNKNSKNKLVLGGIRAYTNLYFSPKNLDDFLKKPNMRINEKDQDFAIYRKIHLSADTENRDINVPVVAIECKTYIDKTMLEGAIATAEKIKNGNPHCLFSVVSEWYEVDTNVDPAYSRIDQIYILRKERRRKHGESNPISADVVIKLFKDVKEHLNRDWSDIDKKIKEKGVVL